MKNKVPSGADWAFMTNAQLIDEFKIRRGEMQRAKKTKKRVDKVQGVLSTAKKASDDLSKKGLLSSLFGKGTDS